MDNSPELAGAQLFLQIERELLAEPDLTLAARRLTQIAATMMQADTAIVWSRRQTGVIEPFAATDSDTARAHASIVNAMRSGVTWDCLETGAVVHVDDVLAARRWPAYEQVIAKAAAVPRSGVAFPLEVQDGRIGALTVLAAKPNRFDEAAIQIGTVLAQHATLCLAAVRNAAVAADLRVAVESNRRIGLALGILMSQHKITDDEAFAMLREASQHGHRKLRDLAEDVIHTGAIPGAPEPR